MARQGRHGGSDLNGNESDDAVRRIFTYERRGTSARASAAALNNEGIRTLRGRPWDASRVRYVLGNERLRRVIRERYQWNGHEYVPKAEASQASESKGGDESTPAGSGGDPPRMPVSRRLDVNEAEMRRILGKDEDVLYRRFTSRHHGVRQGLAVFVDGLANEIAVQQIIQAAVVYTNPPHSPPHVYSDPVLDFKQSVAQNAGVTLADDLDASVQAVLAGETVLFFEGADRVLVVDTRAHPGRNVEEPQVEAEVRGPRDGMVENLVVNTALVRRRVRDPRLSVAYLQVGTRSQTDLALLHIDGLADPEVLAEVKRRIDRIDIDGALASGYIEELIKDSPWSPFTALVSTERPDRVAASLLEGQVVLIIDNTPFALIVPSTFWHHLHSPGDYYINYWLATGLRLIRIMSAFVAVNLPAVYVMLITFHHEMIPTPLALSIAGGREGVPLPAVLETLLMMLMFEVIQEAGLRLPRAVGQTVSIVGALVIGDAAVTAGLVGPATVIVIAIAGITSLTVPSFTLALITRFLRFALVIAAGTLGVFGFLGLGLFITLHLASLRSFGAPYLGPIMPATAPEQRDTLVRLPWWLMRRRPRYATEKRSDRQSQASGPRQPYEPLTRKGKPRRRGEGS